MSDVLPIPDHVDQALVRVVDQFITADKFRALIEAFVTPVQDLEDALTQLQFERQIGTAVGAQLDQIGAIVGQPRQGLSDANYRLWISARILANRANGTVDDSLRIISVMVPGIESSLVEYLPGAYIVNLFGLTADADQVYRILLQVKPAGAGFALVWSVWPSSRVFSFGDSTAPATSTTRGFGDSTDASRGGHFAGVIGTG